VGKKASMDDHCLPRNTLLISSSDLLGKISAKTLKGGGIGSKAIGKDSILVHQRKKPK
jgi:hypothetical protein